MSPKVTILLVVVAVILAGGALFVSKKLSSGSQATVKPGDKLFPGIPVNDITRFTMRDADNSITLEKKGGEWVIKDLYGYPAQFDHVYNTLKNLDDLAVGQKINVRPSSLGRMALGNPDDQSLPAPERGTLIEAYNAAGTKVAACIVGKDRMAKTDPNNPYQFAPSKDGQYLRLPDSESVYLVAQVFNLDKQHENWIHKKLLSVTKDEIKSMTVMNPANESFAISHTNGTAPFVLEDMKDTEKLKNGAVDTLANALAYVNIESVVDPAVTATNTVLDKSWAVTAETFDGTSYTVSVSDTDQANAYMKVGVAFSTPVPDASITNKAERLKLEERSYKYEDKARLLNNKLSPWMYVIPKSKADQLRKTRTDMIEAKKTEPEE
jgi:hypothetical protein